MNIEEKIEEHKEICLKRLKYLEKEMEKLPEGRIYCYDQGDYGIWKVSLKENELRYLRKSERDLAEKLALKKVYEAEAEDLRSEIEACERFLRYKHRHKSHLAELLLKSSESFKSLLKAEYKIQDERLQTWAKDPYEKSNLYPENLKISTSAGVKVRSKSEALIAEELFRLKIPFRYEQICVFGSEKFAPDFTILNPVSYKEQYIEYFGMMDSPEYLERYIHKSEVYVRNNIIPDRDILYFYEGKNSDIDILYIRTRLENFIFGSLQALK